jgi:hypothetical protein
VTSHRPFHSRNENDLAFGIGALAAAAGYYSMASRIPDTRLADAIGPSGLPKIYAIVLAVLAIVLIVRSLRKSTGAERREPKPGRLSPFGALGLLVIGIVYITVVPWLGYLASIAALIAATICYQGVRFTPQVVLLAIGGALFFWLLFVAVLGIPHPSGAWMSLF